VETTAISAGISGNIMYYKFTMKNLEKYKAKQLQDAAKSPITHEKLLQLM
jgi:hypothetical protein